MTWQQVQRQSGNARGSSAVAAQAMGASRLNFVVPTKDGRWINFTHMLPHQAKALSRALGYGHTIDDPRFATQPLFENSEVAQEWEDMAWEALSKKTYAEWEPILLADDDIAFEMARRSEEGLDHAQIIHNGDADHRRRSRSRGRPPGRPGREFRRTPARITRSAPAIGEHDGDVGQDAPSAPAGRVADSLTPFEG